MRELGEIGERRAAQLANTGHWLTLEPRDRTDEYEVPIENPTVLTGLFLPTFLRQFLTALIHTNPKSTYGTYRLIG